MSDTNPQRGELIDGMPAASALTGDLVAADSERRVVEGHHLRPATQQLGDGGQAVVAAKIGSKGGGG